MYRTDENPPLYKWKLFENYSHLINTGVTCRSGGVSTGPYSRFNQALHCGDRKESVIENRKILCRSLNISFDKYTCAEQTHSANICIANEEKCGSGRLDYDNSIKNTDALITGDRNIMINIHTADCVPIAVFDIEKKFGALIHAGWKGTAQLVARRTIEYMIDELGCHSGNMIAGIGPSIGSCCFEIGEETAEILRKSFDYSSKIMQGDSGKYRADLKQANTEQLLDAGLKQQNIEISHICTSCTNKEFYSYRADGGTTGRFAAYMIIK